MHGPLGHQNDPADGSGSGGRIWLIAGTGEGPPMATALLARGWRLRISVVSRAAALAYGQRPGQELAVGAIGGPDGPETGVAAELARAREERDPYRWVIDATHPFATRISAALARTCRSQHQPLLRLLRPDGGAADGVVLADLTDLGDHCRPGERLLLAIGGRRLADAVAASPQAVHHARLLPHGEALGMALAAGLAPPQTRPPAAQRRWRHRAGPLPPLGDHCGALSPLRRTQRGPLAPDLLRPGSAPAVAGTSPGAPGGGGPAAAGTAGTSGPEWPQRLIPAPAKPARCVRNLPPQRTPSPL